MNARLTARGCLITNERNHTVLADQAVVARGVKRMTGLLTRSALGEHEALIIPRCNNIHTCFMRFPIDVIFTKTRRSAEFARPGQRERRAGGIRPPPRPDYCNPRGGRQSSEAGRGSSEASVAVKIVEGLKPFRMVWAWGADAVLELPTHTVSRTRTAVGDRLVIVNADDR